MPEIVHCLDCLFVLEGSPALQVKVRVFSAVCDQISVVVINKLLPEIEEWKHSYIVSTISLIIRVLRANNYLIALS